MRHVASIDPLDRWQGTALVVGGGGIGTALIEALAVRAPGLRLLLTHRAGCNQAPLPGLRQLELDLTVDASLYALAGQLRQLPPLRLVINTAGLLHRGELQPEKRLARLSRRNLEQSFAVNAFGPVLLAKAIEPALSRELPLQFASLSARVASIGDNQLGGWYSYRAAKAAQNQLLRTLALEWRRRLPHCCVSLLHPGTTATALSEPFRGSVKPASLFTPEQAAGYLLDVLTGLDAQQSGRFWAWDGAPIPW